MDLEELKQRVGVQKQHDPTARHFNAEELSAFIKEVERLKKENERMRKLYYNPNALDVIAQIENAELEVERLRSQNEALSVALHHAAGQADALVEAHTLELAREVGRLREENADLREVADAAHMVMMSDLIGIYSPTRPTTQEREERLRKALADANYPMTFS